MESFDCGGPEISHDLGRLGIRELGWFWLVVAEGRAGLLAGGRKGQRLAHANSAGKGRAK